jgi:DNA-binding response OmpR family regulator
MNPAPILDQSMKNKSPSSSHKILAVDDDPDVLDLISLKLGAAGFTVVTSTSGVEALAMVRREMPDLIILDIMMPEVSGLDVCRQLKRNAFTRDIPVIMLTAKKSEIDRIVGLELDADDYIPKPFDLRELKLRVEAALRRRKK